MTSEQLLVIVSAALALLFAYVPGFANWFNPLEATYKRLIMLGLLAVITGAIFGLSCAGIVTSVVCGKEGAVSLVTAFIAAVVANQATFAILPEVGLNKSLSKSDEAPVE